MKAPQFLLLSLAIVVGLSLTMTQGRSDEAWDKLKSKIAEPAKLDETSCLLAQKRALQFLVLGSKEHAAAELRKAVAYQEALYQAFIKRKPCWGFEEARCSVAEARILLAQLTDDWKTLADEIPEAIHGYEVGIKSAERLLAAKAIEVNEAGAAVSDYRGRIAQSKSLLELAKKKTAAGKR